MNNNKIKCPTCIGNGFYRVPYVEAEEEVHARCEDCDGKGKIALDALTPEELRWKGVI